MSKESLRKAMHLSCWGVLIELLKVFVNIQNFFLNDIHDLQHISSSI